jgi:hypothetical protein
MFREHLDVPERSDCAKYGVSPHRFQLFGDLLRGSRIGAPQGRQRACRWLVHRRQPAAIGNEPQGAIPSPSGPSLAPNSSESV